jgi:hypothetical protein
MMIRGGTDYPRLLRKDETQREVVIESLKADSVR